MSRDTQNKNGDESIGTKSSNCSRESTTLNAELGKLVREFRQLWFEKSGEDWTRPHQFLYIFLGSLTYFLGYSFYALSTGTTTLQIGTFDIAPSVVFYALGILFGLSAFFAWILAWVPKKSGPVRLYLSGIALPTFVVYLILLPFHLGGLFSGP